MKRKIALFILSVALLVQPAAMIPAYTANAATTGSSGKKLNLLSTTQCIVFEPNYKAENSLNLAPGTSFTKDPYIKSESRYDAYCFARVEIPTTTFTTTDGTDVVGDAVKMLYGGKEGINTSDWKVVKEIPSATPGTNSVYVVRYIGNSDILKKQASTGRIFDSMTMPSTVSVAGTSKQIASVDDVTGAVSVQGFLVSSADAKDASDAYDSIRDELEETGNNTSNSNKYDDKLQGTVDVLQDEKRDLENQVKALEERLSTKLSTGDAKANEVISGKIFSNADAVDLKGTMPNYDKGYYGAGNTSDTYSWTDLSGKVNTEKKEGYQTKIENGTGLTRNADGTITISAGYHAQQVVQGASGNATASQVVKGVTFSNSSGPQTGSMETITSGDYKISDSGVVSVTTGKYTGTASTSANQYQITSTDITKIIQHNAALSASATDPKVLSGYTYYGANGKSTGTMTNYGHEPTASRLGVYNPGDGNYLYSYLPTNSVDNSGDAGNGYVQRSVKTKLSNLGNATSAHVLSGETFTSSAGLAVTGTMENHGGYTDAQSWVRGNGTTYVRIYPGAYLTSANNGLNLPEITIADNLYSQAEYDQNYTNGYNDGKKAGTTTVYNSFANNYAVLANSTQYGSINSTYSGYSMYLVAMTQAQRSEETSGYYHNAFKFSCSGGNSVRIIDMGVTSDTTGNKDKSGWTSGWLIFPNTDKGSVYIYAIGGRWIRVIGFR